MTPAGILDARTSTVRSTDGTVIAYHSKGHGPGLVVVGGVLYEGSDYMALADALAGEFEVHVMERRGRPGSGPQRQCHSLDDECGDSPSSMRCASTSPASPSHDLLARLLRNFVTPSSPQSCDRRAHDGPSCPPDRGKERPARRCRVCRHTRCHTTINRDRHGQALAHFRGGTALGSQTAPGVVLAHPVSA
jgi:hypothetical protein